MRTPLRFLLTVFAAGACLALGIIMLAPEVHAFFTSGHGGGVEDVIQLSELDQRSLVYARDGKTLMASLHAEENRSPISLDQVPTILSNAILDVEDDKFFVHSGVNLKSTVRAFATNVNSGGVRQGGSTITQQLVKNALLTPEKSVSRKVKEAVLALRLEKKLSKREILERYLNTVYFGNGAYGVQAAAETYFNESVGELTPAQAALLAGIIRNPVGYDPIRFPDAAKARRSAALTRMVIDHHLSQDEADSLRDDPLPTKIFTPLPPPNDYFVEEVKQRLLDDPRLGDTPQERYNAVFRGGLQIVTTYDPQMQAAAVAKVHDILPDTKGKFQAALVSVEPGTGAVRAMVAGQNFENAHYNLATGRGGSGRQPGSSYKPFVLMTALAEGHSPNDTIDGSSPCTMKIPGFAPYTPENVEGESAGIETLTDATVHSVNCAYVRLGADIGLDKVVAMSDKFGFHNRQPYPSISLGAQEVSPLEMATAYAAIADDGVFHPARFVERVTDRNGKVIFQGGDKGTRAVSADIARQTIQVLRQVVQRGTGTAAAVKGRSVAGKTGTSENYENAWFVGFTPNLATAVWMGDPLGNVPMRSVGGIRVFGGTYPARIWSAYMTLALKDLPVVDFPSARIGGGKFIKDKYSVVKHLPTTSTTTTTVPGAPPGPPGGPPPPGPAPVPPGPASTTSSTKP